VDHSQPATGEPLELGSVEDVLPAARREQLPGSPRHCPPRRAAGSSPSTARDPSRRPRAAAVHRARAPRRSSRDRAPQLDLIARRELAGQSHQTRNGPLEP
jgi:hypothetical protein